MQQIPPLCTELLMTQILNYWLLSTANCKRLNPADVHSFVAISHDYVESM